MASSEVFSGPRRKLVLAFDVGTTCSGISYSVLDLDQVQVPEIKSVTSFPAHELISGASKIPSIIYYDRNGKVKAVGAEAVRDGIDETAEDEHWVKVEWFKLHLRSKNALNSGKEIASDILPLPPTKTVVDIFADFLAYLFQCASSYIQDTHANGADLWASVKSQIDFVLSHPNGWEGAQQNEMSKAAVLAKLIPDTTAGHARLSFVTEGEASLHFAIQNGILAGVITDEDGVIIVDAGGSTIDVSSYSKNMNAMKDTFEEIAAPQCYFHGSVFVSLHARRYLENFLADSPFADDVEHIVRCFDNTTKLKFRNPEGAQYIKFGSVKDNDPRYNIRFGQLKLSGSDVALFFEPSINCIVKAIRDQRKIAHKSISHVVIVGGFAASDWVFKKVLEELGSEGLTIIRPESRVNKAVSDGAISFYVDHFVRTRVSKCTYGSFCNILYDPTAADHRERSEKTFVSISGKKRLTDVFNIILPKNTQVSEAKEFRKSYFCDSESKHELKAASFDVWCYRGDIVEPKWKDVDTENYTKLCTIEMDLSHLPLSPRTNPTEPGVYYRLNYEIVLLFGLTQLKAQVAWKMNGVEKRSLAKIVYDPDTANDDSQSTIPAEMAAKEMLNEEASGDTADDDYQSTTPADIAAKEVLNEEGSKKLTAMIASKPGSRPGLLARWIGSRNSSSLEKYKEECDRLHIQNRRLQESMGRMASDYHILKQQYAEADHERQRHKDTIDSLRQEIQRMPRDSKETTT